MRCLSVHRWPVWRGHVRYVWRMWRRLWLPDYGDGEMCVSEWGDTVGGTTIERRGSLSPLGRPVDRHIHRRHRHTSLSLYRRLFNFVKQAWTGVKLALGTLTMQHASPSTLAVVVAVLRFIFAWWSYELTVQIYKLNEIYYFYCLYYSKVIYESHWMLYQNMQYWMKSFACSIKRITMRSLLHLLSSIFVVVHSMFSNKYLRCPLHVFS